jgi:hypothetical protein
MLDKTRPLNGDCKISFAGLPHHSAANPQRVRLELFAGLRPPGRRRQRTPLICFAGFGASRPANPQRPVAQELAIPNLADSSTSTERITSPLGVHASAPWWLSGSPLESQKPISM